MKKIMFAGATAVVFSIAMGAASAYEYKHTAIATAKSEACCSECTCGDDCTCPDCANGSCADGCCQNSNCCEKK